MYKSSIFHTLINRWDFGGVIVYLLVDIQIEVIRVWMISPLAVCFFVESLTNVLLLYEVRETLNDCIFYTNLCITEDDFFKC